MNINITGRHLEVTDALRDRAMEKIRHLGKFFDRVVDVDITLSLDGDQCMAEVRVPVIRGQTIVAQATGNEMYQVIDQAVDKAERQLTRLKEKLIGRRVPRPESVPAVDVAQGEDEDEFEEFQEEYGKERE